ncbi:MAG: DUF4386 domain-containing protein [Anaerolineae bacterium]|nr:DUF4386 domain-containing protein [Anaerolineae bacterium]
MTTAHMSSARFAQNNATVPQANGFRSPQTLARIAAVLYIIIFFAAMFGAIYVKSTLIVPGDTAATISNLTGSTSLYQASSASYLLILMSEIALTVLLYVLFKNVNATLSLMAAAFRLAMTIVHGANLLFQFMVIALITRSDLQAVFEPDQLQALTKTIIDAHDVGWAIGIVFFSFHVLLLGYLVYQSGYMPRLLGVILILAAASYLFDNVALLFVAGYTETPAPLALFIIVAELSFPLWLLIRGVNVERWQQRTLASM